jgi:hypothetical protein
MRPSLPMRLNCGTLLCDDICSLEPLGTLYPLPSTHQQHTHMWAQQPLTCTATKPSLQSACTRIVHATYHILSQQASSCPWHAHPYAPAARCAQPTTHSSHRCASQTTCLPASQPACLPACCSPTPAAPPAHAVILKNSSSSAASSPSPTAPPSPSSLRAASFLAFTLASFRAFSRFFSRSVSRSSSALMPCFSF